LPASFEIHGPFKVPLDPTVRVKAVRTGCPEFWKQAEETERLADRCGCYAFAMRAGKGITPIYVGKATASFKKECFAPHKIASHYNKALANSGKGTALMFFVVLRKTKGKTNKTAIKQVELFLIQNAIKKNSDLSNIKGRKEKKWSIDGVIRSKGKVSKKAKTFRSALGL
jgi:hypothetical protein